VPDQGWCWTPQVDVGWVPYSAGYWGYEPYWGWTWISYEPWGWAPYHSGIWFSYGGRWRWRPDYGRGGWGNRGGIGFGNHWGSAGGNRFLPRGGGVIGRPTANMPSFGTRSNFGTRSGSMAPGAMRTSQPSARGSVNGWQGFQRGNQSGRWPASVNGPSTGFQGRSAPATQGSQYNWQRFASPGPYTGGRAGSGQSPQRGGWQAYSSAPRSYSGGGSAGRAGGWNASAPRSAGSYSNYGGGSRPALNLNRPVMRQRAPSGGGYSGGGHNYSAPSGGGHSSSGGSHGGGGGGSHSSGGGHGGGHR
jgi:hypothetical protein